jgi:hypothetical protein
VHSDEPPRRGDRGRRRQNGRPSRTHPHQTVYRARIRDRPGHRVHRRRHKIISHAPHSRRTQSKDQRRGPRPTFHRDQCVAPYSGGHASQISCVGSQAGIY